MFRVDWSNPKVGVEAIEALVGPYLGSKYDGLLIEDNYLYVRTTSAMSGEEESGVIDLIYNANKTAQTIAIVSQPDQTPFAQPIYRTKNDATSSVVTCPVNTSTVIDFQITAERYIYGGEIIVNNVELGDYCTAEVYDTDSVIPSQYRAALCEAWPSVAMYCIKRYLRPDAVATSLLMDTRPLAAKVSAGLYMRVTYVAVNSGSDRNCVVNYLMAKKL